MCTNCQNTRIELAQAVKDYEVGKAIRIAIKGAKDIAAPAVARMLGKTPRR